MGVCVCVYLIADRVRVVQSTNFAVCAAVQRTLGQHVQLPLVLNVCLP